MKKFTYTPLVLAMAMALPATAQDTDAPAIEEIIITGSFRDSLASALNQKRNATGSVDVIMAEDIASFPDLNLAESLQRVPGVAITRAAGEGRNISVRGLGADFTRVRINGMEAMASSGGTDAIGGANRGRGFDFNVFSSDLFNSIAVHKTASAQVEEGSLGATVDLRAARPFDFDGFTAAVSGQLGYNDLSEEVDPRASFLVSNTFADGTLGALLSVSYSQRTIRDEGASTVRWDNSNDFGSFQGQAESDQLDAINAAFRPRLPRYDAYDHEMERLGVSAAFQFRPTDRTEVNLDVLYSLHDSNRQEVFMQGILNNNAIAEAMDVQNFTIDNTNTVTAASFTNAVVRSENRYDELSTEFLQVTLSGSHEITDRLRVNGLVGQSESNFDNPIQTTLVAQKDGLSFAYDYSGGNRTNPDLMFDPGVSELSGWSTNSVRLRPLTADNTFTTAQVDLEFDLNDNITLRGGINYKQFEFETTEMRRLTGEGDPGGVDLNSNFMTHYNSGLGSNDPWAIPDLDAVVATHNIYSNTGPFEVGVAARRADNYSAEEESLGFFGQLEFHGHIGDTPVRGDVGLRHVETDQESTAWATLDGDPELITGTHSYSNTLPSVNLVFEPIEDVLVRAGYAQVMARAGLASIRPNVSVSASGGALTVSGGNPALEPTTADTYDLGVEIYMSDEAMLGVAVFRKKIDSHVQTLRETKPFTATGLPLQAAIDACELGQGYGSACNENMDWQVTTPLNGPGGDLYGFEVSYQTPFSFLPGFWSNFGTIANFTYVKGQMDYLNAAGEVQTTRDLLGLVEATSSGTLYYEDGPFAGRISVVSRGGYLTHPLGRNNNDREGVNSATNVDAAMSYALSDNLKLTFEALNLTDEADDHWVDANGNRLSFYHTTGRQFYVGAQYKF